MAKKEIDRLGPWYITGDGKGDNPGFVKVQTRERVIYYKDGSESIRYEYREIHRNNKEGTWPAWPTTWSRARGSD